MTEHKIDCRIYYEDTDAGGVVYHANYLKFAERARTEFLRHYGFNQSRLRDELNVVFVVSKQHVVYKRAARLDDLVTINSRITGIKRASFIFEQSVIRREGKEHAVLCELETKVAAVDVNRFSPMPIPNIILEELRE